MLDSLVLASGLCCSTCLWSTQECSSIVSAKFWLQTLNSAALWNVLESRRARAITGDTAIVFALRCVQSLLTLAKSVIHDLIFAQIRASGRFPLDMLVKWEDSASTDKQGWHFLKSLWSEPLGNRDCFLFFACQRDQCWRLEQTPRKECKRGEPSFPIGHFSRF